MLETAPASLGGEPKPAGLGNQPRHVPATVELPDEVVLQTRFKMKVRARGDREGVTGMCPEPAFTFGMRVRRRRVTSDAPTRATPRDRPPRRTATRTRARAPAPQGLAAYGHAK